MEAVEQLCSSLSTSTTPDAKTLEALSVALKRCESPLARETFERLLKALATGLKSSNASLSTPSLAVLCVLFPLLTVTADEGPSQLKIALLALTGHGGLFDRLGDKDRVRDSAGKALLAVGRACIAANASHATTKDSESPLSVLDTLLKDFGLASKAARVREMTLHYVAQIRSEYPKLPLRPYVVPLVTALEDQDQHVRDAAREAVVSIFSSPAIGSAARADLKTQLSKHGVRKGTAEAVLSRVLGRHEVLSESSSSRSHTPDPTGGRNSSGLTAGARGLNGSASSSVSTGTDITSGIRPIYVASEKDLEAEFTKMQPAFAGIETEHNWKGRETNVATIRGMLVGESHLQLLGPFLQGLRLVLDGLLRTLASLRTTLMSNTCHLVAELASSLKTSFDVFADVVLPHLLKMAAQTKKLAVTASQAAVEAILTNCSYREKMMVALSSAMAEKTVQARQAAITQIRTLIRVHGTTNQHAIESGTGIELLEKAIKVGLLDANPAVREIARPTFWLAHAIWSQRFDRVKQGLDAATRVQLDKAGGTASAPVSPNKPRTSVKQIISARRSEAHVSTTMKGTVPPMPRQRTVSASMAPPALPREARSPPRGSFQLPARAPLPPAPPRLSKERTQEAHRMVHSASLIPLPNTGDDTDLISNEQPPFTPGRRSLNGMRSPRKQNESPSRASNDGEMVDEAMRLQAEQAEQAAAQLLQLTEEENHASTPMKPTVASRAVASSVFADSPAQNASDPHFQLKKNLLVPGENWWLREKQSLQGASSEADIDAILSRIGVDTASTDDLLLLAGALQANSTAWLNSQRVDRLFTSLDSLLHSCMTDRKLSDSALVVLRALCREQSTLISGREVALFDLLFDLQKIAPLDAFVKLDAIAGLLGAVVEPLYGIRCLRSSAQRDSLSGKQENAVCTLACRLLGLLFRRMPAEVLEEEIPLAGSILLKSLTQSDSLPRGAANATLVVAAVKLGSETMLFALLPQIRDDQKALITYYYSSAKEAGLHFGL